MNLKEAYKQDLFLEYIKNDFLPGFSKDVRVVAIDDKYKTLKEAKFLGSSEELELSVFELKVNGSAEKKISQARDGFRIMKEYQVYRALMAYYSDEDQNWRFSLMQMTPDLNDKGKIITKISNPRRYSFYLGPDAKIKTAERLLKEKVKDFNDLVDRFNVEIVTKEFYQNYKKLFEKLLDYLKSDKAFTAFSEKHGLKLEIFTKKLLGQIVFIYFLQKKGWLGAKKGDRISNGEKRFLRNLFDKCQQEKSSFFNDYLEYLFYDCLNKMPERAGSFYREKFDCQIPFLNGGLFEPINDYNWKEEFINIPNDIFSTSDESGILDIFDIYNFTIDENTPDDQEVSVDPEMLGKVFENLLEDNIRKGQGAFYTPREIVHYMCQESLINYLDSNSDIGRKTAEEYVKYFDVEEDVKTIAGWEKQMVELDKLMQNIKVCDPACGSGAFLVGMLNEIIKLRYLFRMFNPDLTKKTIYDLKKETIQSCLYGVDIDPGAVDIAKLRFWLSIVVDENIEDIEPLPNLDYKIMQGNSLLEDLVIGDSVIKFNFDGKKKIDGRTREQKELFVQGGVQGKLILEESDTLAEKLEKYHTEYFSVTDPEKKKILKRKIDTIEDELIQSKCQEEIRGAESAAQNSVGDSKKILKSTEKVLAVKGVLDKWKKDHLRPFFPWKLHFSEVFNRENGGFDVVIGNPPYGETVKDGKEYFKKIYYSVEGKFEIYKFFIERGISLLRKSGVLCFITPDTWLTLGYFKKLRKYIIENNFLQQVTDSLYNVFESATVDTVVFSVLKENSNSRVTSIIGSNFLAKGNASIDDAFVINSKSKPDVIKKTESECDILDKFCEIWQGLIAYSSKGQERIYTSNSKETDFHKKLLYGGDIGRYRIKWNGEYLKYGKWLHRPRPKYIFESEKILVQRIRNPKLSRRIVAAYDNEKFINGTGLSNIIIRSDYINKVDLLYILAIINSKLINYWFAYYFKDVNIKPEQLRKIPIKYIQPNSQKKFVDIVRKIFEITKSGDYMNNTEKQNESQGYENEIDQLVYDLYGITDEEIKMIES